MVQLNEFLQEMLQVIFNPQSNDYCFKIYVVLYMSFLLVILRDNRCAKNSGKSKVKFGINWQIQNHSCTKSLANI